MASITANSVTELVEIPLPPDNLPETDEVPLESLWHRWEIGLLSESVICHLEGRTDFFVGGNMFLYYSAEQARNRDYRGPDFFFVRGVDGTRLRRYWAIWDEGGKYPDLIVELLSPSTANEDRTTKKVLYEQTFRTPEYFCYDPDTERLEGWRLQGKGYEEIPADERGWRWSEELQLWLGTRNSMYLNQQATWLRLFDSQGNLVLINAERAEQERQHAEQERQRAEQERQRAETLEAEVARLRALLAQQQAPPRPPATPLDR
jgi:Uma2 family endonuclease